MNKILYVDDAPSMRKLVEMVLSPEFDITLASNGQEGLDAAQQSQYDVIISDINMPVMNGLEFLENVRAIENYKFIPVLMMTTEASREMKDQGKKLGATGWIVKPFDPAKLPAIIRKVL
ncbi:response regulator [Hydrogenovibrio kuenenii]|uniref:response regulator n=1 Tax=Hydrogenovibrio kuenenii TaxID=63658 RepID=UPI000463BFAB|nr:response regulator [Hydrogenovibrio kuenenii]